MRRVALTALLLAGALFAQARMAIQAADLFWNNPAGGVFSDPANWQGGKAPTAADRVLFDTHSSQTVSFASDAATSGLLIHTDDITFQLNSHEYSSITPGLPDGQVWVGRYANDDARLKLLNGAMTVGFLGVGHVPDAKGQVTVGSGASLTFNIADLGGVGGSGRLDVQNGGVLTSPDGAIFVGNYYGSAGTLNVDGPDTLFDVHQVSIDSGSFKLSGGAQATSVVADLGSGRLIDYSATAYIQGSGTTWQVDRIRLAQSGYAGMSISNSSGSSEKASVETHELYIGQGANANASWGSVAIEGFASLTTDVARVGDTSRGDITLLWNGELHSNHTTIGRTAGADGDVLVNLFSSWNNTAEIKVGEGGSGRLRILSASQVTGGNNPAVASQIGVAMGAQGEVIVADGSSWTMASPLYVGILGEGSLTIRNHSVVSNTKATIGWLEGSTGQVEVVGKNAQWINSTTLAVGGDPNFVGGNGSLEIADGGLVKVTGTTTVWETGSVHLDAGTLQATTVNLSGGSLDGIGTVIGNLNNSGEVSPGTSPGTLKVQGDFSQSLDGLLKLEIGATAADLLQVNGNAKLGGTLHLSLLGGFTPSYGTTYDLLTASKLSGAFDTLELPDLGPGRAWQFNYGADRFSVTAVPEPSTLVLALLGLVGMFLVVVRRRSLVSAKSSTGQVAIRAVASVVACLLAVPTSSAAVVDWNNPAGGTFSDGANWQGGKAPTATDRAVFDNSAEYVVSFGADASTSGLTIGTEKITLQLNGQSYNTGDPFNPAVIGTDTADVARLFLLNGVLKAGRVEVGDPSGAQGYLQIGKAATLHLTESKSVRMTVSNGELRVIEGGSITSAPDARIGVGSPRTNNSPISSATFVVDGLGSTVTTSEVNLGVGSLTVQSGGLISAYYVSLRQSDLALESSALVTGLNSKLLASSTISVGGATLSITDRATVSTIDFNISSGNDDAKFTEGVVVVSNGGKLVASDDFRIGGTLYLSDGTVIPGKGTLKVVESGAFTSRSAMIAGADNNVGLVEIDGIGSTWHNSAEIHVGRNGHGKLVVSGGGQVTGGNVPNFASAIGYWTDSEGEVLLTDEGSAWTLSSPLHVGVLGHGSLTIQNGADLSNTTSAIASIADSSGHALVTGAGSTWTSSKNMGIGGDPNLAGGSGSLEIAASGLVKVAGIATVWETGSVHLDAGTLQATTINLSGGLLGGIGSIIGNLNNSGEVSPGNSPGTLKVQGNFSQSLDGLLTLEIGATAADLLQVTGNAKLGGTLHLSLLGGFTPSYGTTYDLLTASKLSGAFDTLELPDLGPGRAWQFNYGADRFSVTAVPEPSTIVLGAIGGVVCLAVAMRRRKG